MRGIQLLAFVAAIVVLLLPFLRRPSPPATPSATPSDELVKDPVCQTYVVRSRAVTREGPQGRRYFCSDACARRDA
jgi:hypothetical protein